MFMSPFEIFMGGAYNYSSGGFRSRGGDGRYWLRTKAANSCGNFDIDSNLVTSGSWDCGYGMNLRCLAR